MRSGLPSPQEAEDVFRAAGALTVRDLGRGGADRGGRGGRSDVYGDANLRRAGKSDARRRDGGAEGDERELEGGDARSRAKSSTRASRGAVGEKQGSPVTDVTDVTVGEKQGDRETAAGGGCGERGRRYRVEDDVDTRAATRDSDRRTRGQAGFGQVDTRGHVDRRDSAERGGAASRPSKKFSWDESEKSEAKRGNGGPGGAGDGLMGDLMKGHSQGRRGSGPEDGLSAIMVDNTHRNAERAARQELRSLACQHGVCD